jgi:replication factor C subunit 2/4
VSDNRFPNPSSVPRLQEYVKLQFLREIGTTHMWIAEGMGSLLQLSALLGRLCKVVLEGRQ